MKNKLYPKKRFKYKIGFYDILIKKEYVYSDVGYDDNNLFIEGIIGSKKEKQKKYMYEFRSISVPSRFKSNFYTEEQKKKRDLKVKLNKLIYAK